MLIPLEKQSEALEILGSTIEETLFDPGCISCRLYHGVEDALTIMIEELWTSEEELQHHLQSDNYRKILLVVEMAAEPPESLTIDIQSSACWQVPSFYIIC